MKLEAINQAAKMQIIDKLAAMCRIGNAETMRKLDNIRSEINRQSNVGSMKLIEIDTFIYKYLTELENDLRQNSFRVADIRMSKISAILSKRASECSSVGDTTLMTKQEKKAREQAEKLMIKAAQKNGIDLGTTAVPIGDLYSDSDLYEIMVAQLQDENDSISREIEELRNKQYAAPNDIYLQNKLTSTQIKLSGVQQKMRIMCDENNRNAYVMAMQAVTEADKMAIANRSVSEAQYKAVQSSYTEVMKRRDAESRGFANDFSQFINAGSRAEAGTFAASSATGGFDAVSAMQNGGVASGQSYSRLYSDIDPIVKALDRSRGIYAGKLDEYGKKLMAIDRELAAKLEKRRTMTASERLVFDGQIDTLNSERNGIVTSIKKYRQIQAINDDKMKLAKDLQQQMEINKVEAEAGRLAGSLMQDWEQVAMELNKFIHNGNEELERMADANAVASSEEIGIRSATGTQMADTEVIDSDDDKYAQLERELGLIE